MIPAGEARAIRSVGIVGGGIVGLSAAIAFARALPKARIGLLETSPDRAALADRLSGSLTSIHGFHRFLGLDEAALIASGAATYRLGTRFERWSADGETWHHAFGDYGRDADGGVSFHQLWARARRAGEAAGFDRYSAAALIAEAGRFVHPSNDPASPLSSYSYALRLDPDRYRQVLQAVAGSLPISRLQGELGGIERREDGGIEALRLADGRRLEADLYLDCAGPGAALLSKVDDRFEDWSEWLPCDRLLIASVPDPAGPSSCDTATATSIGWIGGAPLHGRKLVSLAYASSAAGEGKARRLLRTEAGAESAEAVEIRLGRRPEPWVRNVLAIGEAATAVDPLQGTNLHLAQSAIMRALGLLPGRDCHPLELSEYNRRNEEQMLRVRDFIALHYLRSGVQRGEFWKGLAGRTPPATLAHTLEQFERRGRLPFYENESFDRHAWLASLLGMGVMPGHIDPVAASVAPDQAKAALERMRQGLAPVAERLPPYRDYLAHIAAGAARAR
jgi:tryptophan 7-halogenase